MKKRLFRSIIPLAIVLATSYFYINAQNRYETNSVSTPYRGKKFLLDTVVNLQIYGNKEIAKKTEKQVYAELSRIEKIGEVHNESSEISKLNSNINFSDGADFGNTLSGRRGRQLSFKLSLDLANMIGVSLKYAKLTDGAFNPLLGNVINLWSIGDKNNLPSEKKIKSALSSSNWQQLHLEKSTLTCPTWQKGLFDLGGVLKGYAIDKAADLIVQQKVGSALISTVSSTKTVGSKPNGEPWKIGIENPRKGRGNDIIGVLELGPGYSVSTSGDYQRYFIKNSKRYSHIIDPATGHPSSKCISVTIVTKRSAAEADILSTAIFVKGFPGGMDFARKLRDVDVFMVDTKGFAHSSMGMKKILKSTVKSIYE